MKKILMATVALGCALSWAQVGHAGLLITDIDTTDLWTMYGSSWVGDDKNPDYVRPSDPLAEEEWLEALLGLQFNDPTVTYVDKFDFPDTTDFKFLSSYNPGFAWDYAIVKIGGPKSADSSHWAYSDLNDDDLLSVGTYDYGISHITYFNKGSNPPPVPEPATMLLFGTGLAGLAAVARRRRN